MRMFAVLLAVALAAVSGTPTAADVTSEDKAIVHVLNRLAFGPRPGDVEAVRSGGIQRYIELQLHPERVDDAAVGHRLERLTTLDMSPRDLVRQFQLPLLAARRERQQQSPAGSQPDTPSVPERPSPALVRQAGTPMLEVSEQKLLRAIYSERQLEEVLVDFWFNHFNVDARKGPVRFMLAEYEREAIRPHVLGRFRDLLGATAKSPAMLFYLDNWMSAAPESARGPTASRLVPRPRQGRVPLFGQAGQTPSGQVAPAPTRAPANGRRGLNENYARELMELHTLGVDGGFTQQDVTEVARVFTGWTISQPRLGGGFVFDARLHDGGTKTVLGQSIEASGMREGERVLDILSRHPSTARFVATKLARRFISDSPPPAIVERAAGRFRDTDGDLREVMRVIVTSPEFLSPGVYRAKVKTPLEFVVSAVRATGADIADARPLARALQGLGMPLYQCQPPTGYRDDGDAWVNSGALLARMNFALTLSGSRSVVHAPSPDVLFGGDVSDTTRATIARAPDRARSLALALGSPEFQKR